jgi:hypothetical protein
MRDAGEGVRTGVTERISDRPCEDEMLTQEG